MSILGDIGSKFGSELKSLSDRVTTLEGTVPPPSGGLTAETVNWTNLSEINLSGEKLTNADFSQTELAQDPSYAFPTGSNPPPNGWGWEEFVVDVQVEWIGTTTANHTQGTVYQANAYRPAWDNYDGNLRIKNDSDNYGWVGNNRGTDWEVVENGFLNWSVNSSVGLDLAKLAQGIVKGNGGAVSVQQMFSNPIASGTKLVAKATRADTNADGHVRFQTLRANGTPYGSLHDVPYADGYVEFETTEATYGLRLSTAHGTREVSSVSLFQGAVSGGSVQTYAGGSIEKISGAGSYNAGASSVQKIDGNSDGYFQFQISHGTHSLKVGVVNQDHDFEVDAPWKLNFGGGHIDLSSPWITDHTAFVAGDWFRIRHYANDNEVQFQKRQTIYSELPNFALPTSPNNGHPHHHTFDVEDRPLVVSLETQTVNGVELTEGKAFKIKKYNVSTEAVDLVQLDGTDIGWGSGARASKWEVAEELGEDYVKFYTHPTLTNGSDLYLDTVFHAVGARLNDVQIAT